jgi:hypothetical protein
LPLIRLFSPTTMVFMPNGKVGDRPLTDILVHNVNVYGSEADNLIRKIAQLSSRKELDDSWNREIGWSPDTSLIIPKAQQRDETIETGRLGDSGL